MSIRFFAALLLALAIVPVASAQMPGADAPLAPTTFEILGITVEGVEEDYTRSFVRQASGLREGQRVTLPGDQALGDAIRAIYRLGMFSHVRIVEDQRLDNGLYLAIQVTEVPKLGDIRFEGVKKRRDEPTIRNEIGRQLACSENIDVQIGRVL